MNLRLVSVLALALGFSLACGGGSTTTETPPPPPPPADGSIGVAECDAYIKKVDDCMGKLDATAKTAFESSSKQMVDAWKQAAATPEGKAGLAQGCKMAVDMFTCPEMPATGAVVPATGAPPADGTAATPAAGAAAGTAAAVTAGGTTATGTGAGATVTTTAPDGTTTTVSGGGRSLPPANAKAPPRPDRNDGDGNKRDGKRNGKGDGKGDGEQGMGRSR